MSWARLREVTDPAATTERGALSDEAAELIARIRGVAAGAAPASPEDDLRATDFHGRYKLVRQLGEGAMGTVWQASDKKLRRTVAVKLLKPDLQKNPIVVERAIAEARAASHARHEHIVEIFDVGTLPDGAIFTVMEWLEGRTLSSLLEETRSLPWKRCRGVLLQLAEAMAHAHRCGITHRDLKPDNIFVCARGPIPDFCKVIDFGLSKDAGIAKRLTQTGQLLGTPYYMSPEQVLGRSADRRSDIYGLGVIAFELLTGSRPFDGNSVYELFTAHVEGPIPHVPDDLDTLEHDIDAVIQKALAKDPEARFASMEELVSALARIPEEFAIQPPPLVTIPRAPTRSRPWFRPVHGLLIVALIASGAIAGLFWFEPDTRGTEAGDAAFAPVGDVQLGDDEALPPAGAPTAPVSAPVEPVISGPPPATPPADVPRTGPAAVVETTMPEAGGSRGRGPGRGGERLRGATGPSKPLKDPAQDSPPPVPTPTPAKGSKTDELFDEIEKIDGTRDDSNRGSRKKPELLGD